MRDSNLLGASLARRVRKRSRILSTEYTGPAPRTALQPVPFNSGWTHVGDGPSMSQSLHAHRFAGPTIPSLGDLTDNTTLYKWHIRL
jgi:hypothetical protein